MLERGGKAGCFACLATFEASEINRWMHREGTAQCPFCGRDTVLPAANTRTDATFLKAMRDRWLPTAATIA